jgi:hypothetical protein
VNFKVISFGPKSTRSEEFAHATGGGNGTAFDKYNVHADR